MKCSYTDILNIIPSDPLWWDERGVPRYVEFCPSLSSNPYAHEVALLIVECQACSYRFRVCLSSDHFDSIHNESLSLLEQHPHLYYGDPPNKPCCRPGPTMTSVSRHILQFWVKEKESETGRILFIMAARALRDR